jgi:dGTPase
MRLSWNKLITTKRFKGATYELPSDARTEFERDYDRIIFSSPFRRLKDKTQVFPVPKSDFVHTRLTHSIEVASIGRSLGKLVGKFVLENEDVSDGNGRKVSITEDDFGNIVAAACCAHDIGNPPFGHSGEESFGLFFSKLFTSDLFSKSYKLTDEQKEDFLKFEGNAEGFRLLTNDHPSGKPGGLKLTYSTLAAFTKYPAESIVKSVNELGLKIDKRRSKKKYGFFQKEKDIYAEVASELGLFKLSDANYYWCRHPLAFLVEAADNICYSIIDLEDGHKIRLINTEEAVGLLKPLAFSIPNDPCPPNEFDSIVDKDEKIGAYRAKTINALIYQCFEVFKLNYDKIMTATFDEELTDLIKSKDELNLVVERNRKFFKDEKVIQIESGGRHVIGGLLQLYFEAYLNADKKYAQNILSLLPTQFHVDEQTDIYTALLNISGFVSRMTDNYAIDHYRTLTGHKLPEII